MIYTNDTNLNVNSIKEMGIDVTFFDAKSENVSAGSGAHIITYGNCFLIFHDEDCNKAWEFMKRDFIISKSDILGALSQEIVSLKVQKDEDTFYAGSLIRLLEDFYNSIEKARLFDAPSDGNWHYIMTVDVFGASLTLVRERVFARVSDSLHFSCMPEEKYCLIREKARMLPISEYAKLKNVKEVTIRQRISRGVLRSCKKFGTKWRISELARDKERGPINEVFEWKSPVDFPSHFELGDCREYHCACVYKEFSTEHYKLLLKKSVNDTEGHQIDLSSEKGDELIRFLSSNPFIKKQLLNLIVITNSSCST